MPRSLTQVLHGQIGRWASAVLAVLFAMTAAVLVPSPPASADGTETLGPATIPIAPGTGIVVAGTGLFVQPSSFDVVVPADAIVEQVILYWESGHQAGDLSGEFSDETLTVNGNEVTAPHAGGPSVFYTRDGVDVITSTHRIDITDLGLVGPGTSTLTVDGLDSDEIDDGAGVVVIYSQGGVVNDLQVFDGNDIAFAGFAPPRDTTVPQTYTFAPENRDRNAEIGLMATSTHTTDTQDSAPRPSALLYTVGGVTTRINDPFPDTEGREFDSVTVPIVVPAGATALTIQMLSDDNGTSYLPASLVWLVGTLALEVQQFGSLVIRKAVAAGVDPTATFDIDLDCTDDTFDETLTLAGGAEATIADIPIGTTCTVSETPLPGFAAPTYTPADTVTIDAPNITVTITVTNTAIPPVLPETGGHLGPQLWLAVILLAVGATLVAATRQHGRAGGRRRT